MLDKYERDPDPGIHSALGWSLRNLNRGPAVNEIDRKLATGQIEGNRQWLVGKDGTTFAVVEGPAKDLLRPSKTGSPSGPHRFAISTTEVTVAKFREFSPQHKFAAEIAENDACPANRISWVNAAKYCIWRCQRDNIPKDQWCFVIKGDGEIDIVPDYQSRTGYRLPTEEEWVYACRASARTPCSFGRPDPELASAYACWSGIDPSGRQATIPVGSRKPNDFGLFDMHGNVCEWCQESSKPLQGGFVGDVESGGRGSSYYNGFERIGVERRFQMPRKFFYPETGFRIANTILRSNN